MATVKKLGILGLFILIVAGHDCNLQARKRLRCRKERPIPSRGYDRVGARIPYWISTFPDCMSFCKNDTICVDYCSFRFGINPNLPGKNVTLITKWDYPFPIFVNGTWFYSGRTHTPHRPYPYYPHQGYPHYPQILPENHTHPHYYPYPHHENHLQPKRQHCHSYPPVCYKHNLDWCLKQITKNLRRPCKEPRYKPSSRKFYGSRYPRSRDCCECPERVRKHCPDCCCPCDNENLDPGYF